MSPEAYNGKILSALEQIQRDVSEIKGRMGSGGGGGGGGGSSDVASDSDLDGQHGDPLIKYDPKPRYWTGESYAGCRFSETTPDYLDAMANYLGACAYMAQKDAAAGKDVEKNEKSARYKGLDAARARGWAARLRAGAVPTAQAAGAGPGEAGDYGNDEALPGDDIPFLFVEHRFGRA